MNTIDIGGVTTNPELKVGDAFIFDGEIWVKASEDNERCDFQAVCLSRLLFRGYPIRSMFSATGEYLMPVDLAVTATSRKAPPSTAAQLLVDAYARAEETQSTDWADIDAAHAQALKEIAP